MSGTGDDMMGRAKEAAGDLTGNDDLRREGQVDQASGKVKDKLSSASDWVEDKVDSAKRKMRD